MLAAFEVVLLRFKHFNDSQQFAVMGFIPSLGWNHLSREKSYRMSLAWIIQGQFTQNPTNSIAQIIRLNLDMTLRSKWFSIGASTNACFNLIKALLVSAVKNVSDWLRLLALDAYAFLAWIYFLDFAIFWLLRLFCIGSFLSQFSTWIPLPSCLSFTAGPTAEAVFNMKMNRAASLLNP